MGNCPTAYEQKRGVIHPTCRMLTGSSGAVEPKSSTSMSRMSMRDSAVPPSLPGQFQNVVNNSAASSAMSLFQFNVLRDSAYQVRAR
jgi:hypothetical protein